MTQADPTDAPGWRKRFASMANNRAWDLTTAERTPAEDREMLDAAHASAWLWQPIGNELNHMRATLLLAEVYALLGRGQEALRYATQMHGYFTTQPSTPDWELAFTHAIHAHAAHAAGNRELHRTAYAQARAAVDAIAEKEDRDIVLKTFDHVPKPFTFPADLMFNRGQVEDPAAYAKERGCASWLFLVGDEFASMPGGISYEQVRQAAPVTDRVVSDPPRVLTVDLARQHVAALDKLPRPTLLTCRAGPRSSAVAYMYAGLQQGASPDDVIAAGEADNAPFCTVPENKEWVRTAMQALRAEMGEKQ